LRRLAIEAEAVEDGRNEFGRDFDEHRLKAGDVAMLVDRVPHPAGGEDGAVLQVFNALGESIAVVAVPESAVGSLRGDEVPAVRGLASAS
jgi:hypothetical protein